MQRSSYGSHSHSNRLMTPLLALMLFIMVFLIGPPVSWATSADTLNLDGVDDYVRVENAPELNPSGAITIEAWIRRDEATRCETIVGKNFITGFWLGLCDSSELGRNVVRFYTNGIGTAEDGDLQVPAGTWTHIAVTFDGTVRNYYVNGMRLYTSTSPSPLAVNDDPLAIGADADGSYPFRGNIAAVRLWSLARSQTDVRRDMIHLINEPRPGLVAAWHLESNAQDVFGSLPGTPVGGANFGGPAAPPVDHGPILIPRLATAPTVDGVCGAGAYGNLRLPIWNSAGWSPTGLEWVYLGATASDLYLCHVSAQAPGGSDIARVYLDPHGDGGDVPQSNDYRLGVLEDDTLISERGTGSGGYTIAGGLTDVAAAADQFEFDWSTEFRIGRGAFPATDAIFGMQFTRTSGNTYGYPVDYAPNHPQAWPTFQINDGDPPRPDSANPVLSSILHSPGMPMEDEDVTITAQAWDDVDIATVNIIVDGAIVRSCAFNDSNDVSAVCDTTPRSYDLGVHTYYACVRDHRGRGDCSPRASFFVRIDGEAPVITTSYTPERPALGGTVAIEANASDPSGIVGMSISVGALGRTYDCPLTIGAQSVSCRFTFGIPVGTHILYYRLRAEDAEGLRAATPPLAIVVATGGPDDDSDGLSNNLEAWLCTSPTNPDTDRDGLNDRWEVLGLRFDTGETINLPLLGANPCRRDVFLQLDYDASTPFGSRDLQAVASVYRDHGITLHVSGKEHPAPPPGTQTVLAAEGASVDRDADGNYYFAPELHWTHYYGYARDREGSSAYAGRFLTIDMRGTSDRSYRLMHELGHAIGLGHGGISGPDTQLRNGDMIWYDVSRIGPNRKPNYGSVMNYRWPNSLCWNPTAGTFTDEFNYSETALPTLDETDLDERPTSAFANAVRAQSCDPGSQAVVRYSCADPDEADRPYLMLSNGTQTVARKRRGSPWQTSGLPAHAPGIDWNCDGSISTHVASNLNGDGHHFDLPSPFPAPSETLVGSRDWPYIPHGRSCAVPDSEHIPADYKAEIPGPDCPTTDSTHNRVADFPLSPDADRQSPDPPIESLIADLPGLEICDGKDNDGDGDIDEGCADVDGDHIVDALDNCPTTTNAAQADPDDDQLGEACQNPLVLNLQITEESDDSVILEWDGSITDVLGFNVYRQESENGNIAFLGNDNVSTITTSFTDTSATADSYRYVVHAVNLNGVEGPPAEVTVGPFNFPVPDMRVYLPAISNR